MSSGADEVALEAPACEGPRPPFPRLHSECVIFGFANELFSIACARMGYIASASTRSRLPRACRRRYLVQLFGSMLGYMREVVHVYKEFWGRELLMRRVVRDGGATSWEPRYVHSSLFCKAGSSLRESVVGPCSSLVQGAWAGRLVHFRELDVFGPTAGAVVRLLQDREFGLWEGTRIVESLGDDGAGAFRHFPVSRLLD
jgi:hypothetical protein